MDDRAADLVVYSGVGMSCNVVEEVPDARGTGFDQGCVLGSANTTCVVEDSIDDFMHESLHLEIGFVIFIKRWSVLDFYDIDQSDEGIWRVLGSGSDDVLELR